jgi:hypothetical protein
MTRTLSFTKFEHELLPHYREALNAAESVEDVRAAFAATARDLCAGAVQEDAAIGPEDFRLDPAAREGYAVSQRLRGRPWFPGLLAGSDLPRILGRLAELALKRYKHLAKHLERTESQMYKAPDYRRG